MRLDHDEARALMCEPLDEAEWLSAIERRLALSALAPRLGRCAGPIRRRLTAAKFAKRKEAEMLQALGEAAGLGHPKASLVFVVDSLTIKPSLATFWRGVRDMGWDELAVRIVPVIYESGERVPESILKDALRLIDPKTVVAVGGRAATALHDVRIGNLEAKHPTWWERMGEGDYANHLSEIGVPEGRWADEDMPVGPAIWQPVEGALDVYRPGAVDETPPPLKVIPDTENPAQLARSALGHGWALICDRLKAARGDSAALARGAKPLHPTPGDMQKLAQAAAAIPAPIAERIGLRLGDVRTA